MKQTPKGQRNMKTTKAAKKSNGHTKLRAVLVTTAHRGVFMGYASDVDGETIALKRARLCVYGRRT